MGNETSAARLRARALRGRRVCSGFHRARVCHAPLEVDSVAGLRVLFDIIVEALDEVAHELAAGGLGGTAL